MAARLSTPIRVRGVRVLEQSPEPGRLWVRYRPAVWPTAATPWVDVGECAIGAVATFADALGDLLPSEGIDGRIYLPPVRSERRAERDDLAARLGEAGSTVLVQLLPGESPPAGCETAVDLLQTLLSADLDQISGTAAGALAIWPLIPGVTDRSRLVQDGLERLVDAGVESVFALEPTLDAGERRWLAENRSPEVFDALFHAPAPEVSERSFAAAARAAGLGPFQDRPEVDGPLAANRRAAGVLAAIADLWLRLERPVGRGQAYLRASRWADRLERDLEALWREGNLHVLEWVDGEIGQVLEELFRKGGSSLLAELRDEFAG